MTIEKNWIQRRLLDRLTIWGKAGGHIEYMCSARCIKLMPLIRYTVARESLTFLYNFALLRERKKNCFSFWARARAEAKKPTASLHRHPIAFSTSLGNLVPLFPTIVKISCHLCSNSLGTIHTYILIYLLIPSCSRSKILRKAGSVCVFLFSHDTLPHLYFRCQWTPQATTSHAPMTLKSQELCEQPRFWSLPWKRWLKMGLTHEFS